MVIGRWFRTILRLWYDQDVVAGLDSNNGTYRLYCLSLV